MIEDGEELMAWMVAPTPLVEFFGGTWEHRILHISRPKNRTYFDGWLSKKDIDAMLNDGLQYGLQVKTITAHQTRGETQHQISDWELLRVKQRFTNQQKGLQYLFEIKF